MAYNAGAFIHDYHSENTKRIRERVSKNSEVRDEKARKMMEELKKQRIAENRPSPREPVLVSRRMKHLPPVADYLRQQKSDV